MKINIANENIPFYHTTAAVSMLGKRGHRVLRI